MVERTYMTPCGNIYYWVNKTEKAGMLTGQVIIVQQIEFSSKYEYN